MRPLKKGISRGFASRSISRQHALSNSAVISPVTIAGLSEDTSRKWTSSRLRSSRTTRISSLIATARRGFASLASTTWLTIGKSIEVGGAFYQVVGVLEKRKGQFFKDPSADKVVVVPYGSYRKHNPQDDENFIGAQAFPGRKAQAEDEIIGLMRRRRAVAIGKSNNFAISSSEGIARQFRQIKGAIAIAVVVISSIGLLIGGVGVMNIMLMSVTERTREIGVRKAIGARRRDIIRQFLTEAITLTGSGGIIGVSLGAGISFLINKLLPSLPSSVPLWSVVAAVTASMSVGLFFGIYPAMKASRLDPVDALRYE